MPEISYEKWRQMSPTEQWKWLDKEAFKKLTQERYQSTCPKHVWIKGNYYNATYLICGLHRIKHPNQYQYRYSKKAKYSQEDVNKRWRMYNQGIDLEKYDKQEHEALMKKYR